DDVPMAVNDTDSIATGSFGPAEGNVITGEGTTSGSSGADTKGADGAVVSGVAVGDTGTAITDGTGVGAVVNGLYGTLTLNPDGSYSYTRNAGTPGGVDDVFTYTLTDGDGDTSTATLTISIGDATPTLHLPTAGAAGTSVNEAGLPAGSGEMADGDPDNNSDPSETTTGAITFTPGDTPAVVTIDGVTVSGTVGQTFNGAYGTLTIAAGTDLAAGTINYSYTLTTNTSGDDTFDSFAVEVTDANGDPASGTLNIAIVDDVPTAMNDTDSIAAGSFGPAQGNVITGEGTTSGSSGADTQGADGAQVSGVASNNMPGNTDTTADGAGNFSVAGQYGVLTLNVDGSYSYTRNPGTPGGVNEVFTYTLTDG